MTETPKSLRVHIGIFGRANAGKSSLLNLIAGQSLAIVSEIAGTTTDVVRKSMELLPIGPVTFLDTAGIDDASLLGEQRTAKTREALDSADIALIVTENGQWGAYERELAAAAKGARRRSFRSSQKPTYAFPILHGLQNCDPKSKQPAARIAPQVRSPSPARLPPQIRRSASNSSTHSPQPCLRCARRASWPRRPFSAISSTGTKRGKVR